MAGVMTTGDFPKFLAPGINKIYGAAYREYPVEYLDFFDFNTSERAFEEDVGYVGLGLAPVKAQGTATVYDSMTQGFIKRYTMVGYSLGFIITYEAYSDSQYSITQQMMRKPKALAFSMRQTKETVHANIFNRGFNDSYTGADGKELFATDHPNAGGAGGTFQNTPTNASDLNEASLEDACIAIGDFTNDRGMKISIKPIMLGIPTALKFEALRILKSEGQNDTANNATNALRVSGIIPKIAENHYFTDSDAWFVRTNCPDGIKTFEREKDGFGSDNDFDTKNAKFAAYGRYACGWTDPRGAYGSPGV